MADITGKKILMLVAFEGFRDEECLEPKKLFEDARAEVTIASTQTGTAKGKLGGTVEVDADYSDIDAAEYDAVVFVGGPGAAAYLEDETAQKLAKDAESAGKLVAAICIAPSILANAGLLQGKKATAFSSEEENLKAKGAVWQPSGVVADGKIITGSGPDVASEFGRRIISLLG